MVGAGILSLPTTRSTSGNFPYWLTVDHRTIADEFFRGSYSSGFFAMRRPASGRRLLRDAREQPEHPRRRRRPAGRDLTTTSGRSGGCRRRANSDLAPDSATTKIIRMSPRGSACTSPSARRTRSSSPAPTTSTTRRSGCRTAPSSSRPAPWPQVSRSSNVDYYMAAFDAGMKYRGLALEGEYYLRWLNHFKADGPLPLDHMFDQGFQVMASGMAVPKTLQLYTMGSASSASSANPGRSSPVSTGGFSGAARYG